MDERPDAPVRPERRQGGDLLAGARLGDRRLRVARPERVEVSIPKRRVRDRALHPALVFVYGFAALIALGSVVLMLPISSASGEWTPYVDALFTATSAVCVTGLVVLDTGTYWSGLGQAVVLGLIQLGGFGFMTSSTLVLLVLRRQASLRERVLLSEAFGGEAVGAVITLVRRVAIFTIALELVGWVILSARALPEFGFPGAFWWGLFHSVSAFNNAGFDVVGGFRSLIPYQQDPVILTTIALLFMIGGISYLVVEDLIGRRRFVDLALDTKLVLTTTGVLVMLGLVGLLFVERDNPATFGAMEPVTRLANGFFQAVTPRTAGFSSIDIGKMTEPGLIIVIALMFVGAASGSTAGGIKVQTFSLLLFAIFSAVRGAEEVEAFRRRIPITIVMRAIAVALLSLAIVFLAAFALTLTEEAAFLPVFFEAFSAFGTVGLSTGITPDTSTLGRVIIIVTMFVGRLGPLTLVLALAARLRPRAYRLPAEPVRIG